MGKSSGCENMEDMICLGVERHGRGHNGLDLAHNTLRHRHGGNEEWMGFPMYGHKACKSCIHRRSNIDKVMLHATKLALSCHS